MPAKVSRIVDTFLTDTHDMYTIVETYQEEFQIYHIDLDSPDPRLQGPIFEYGFDLVGAKLLQSFHVRGSSKKEKINLNKVLICYMMHGNSLWSVTPNLATPQKIDDNAHNLYYLSDDSFFYMVTEEIQINERNASVQHSQVYMIESQFGNYTKTAIYKDKDIRAEILNFGVDNTRRRLIILTGIKNQKNKRDKYITIYDIDSATVLYQLMIHSTEIIGRLKSNLYNFVEGHIYYGNKVIKVRYDLLEAKKGKKIEENQFFDHYSEILGLKDPNDYV